jgi:hypothetical protein
MIATTTVGSRYVQNTANNTEKCNVFFSHCSTIYDVTVEFESAVHSAFPAASSVPRLLHNKCEVRGVSGTATVVKFGPL